MPRKRCKLAELLRTLKELDEKSMCLQDPARRDKERLDKVLKELLERARARRRPRIIAQLGMREPFPWELTVVAE